MANSTLTEDVIKFSWSQEIGFLIPDIMILPLVNRNLYAALLMGELEYRFHKKPSGFYMYYVPQPNLSDYFPGASWSEKLRISPVDFKLNFDQIGFRYDSLREFAESENKFKNKYYCSFYDEKRKQAYYIRNHSLVSKDVGEVFGDVNIGSLYEARYLELNQLMEKALNETEQRKQNNEELTLELLA